MSNARTRLAVPIAILLIALTAPACTDGRPPVGVAESGLSAEAWIVPQEDVIGFVEERGGSLPVFVAVDRGVEPAAVVRVDWTSQDLPENARFQIVVLDPSGQDVATTLQTSPEDDGISIGWDERYQELATLYPWLDATRSTKDWMAVAFRPGMDGPMWIVARFPRNGAIGVARPNDVPIVGAFLTSDRDEEIWWAEQLTGG